jgi:uncharacterized protein (TIGR03000 family)
MSHVSPQFPSKQLVNVPVSPCFLAGGYAMKTLLRSGVLVAAFATLFAIDAQACGRHGGSYCCATSCWYPCCPSPCWPCCPPDTTPISPTHPAPTQPAATIVFKNTSAVETFTIVWLRYPDCVYRQYRKYQQVPGPTGDVIDNSYVQGDSLLLERWWRWNPNDSWHCACSCLVCVSSVNGDVDVTKCTFTPTYGKKAASNAASPATIIVTLPSDATLYFDGKLTASTSTQRVFTTPAIEPGKDYSYTLKAEVIQDGKARTLTEIVNVRGGEETRLRLNFEGAAMASAK